MPKTQELIDSYFPSQKRSASECIPSPGKSNAKKLVALDDGSSSPVRSPVRARHLRAARNERPKSAEPVRGTHFQEAERADPTPSPVAEKYSKDATLLEKCFGKRSVLQEPTPHDEKFKKLIRNSEKYPALKAAAKKLKKTIKDLKEKAPSSVPIDAVPVRRRTESTKPCFARFEHLAAVSPNTLMLPSEYAALENIFSGVETVVRSLANERKTVTFKLIQRDVQKLTGRAFANQELRMVKTVYPDSYELRYESDDIIIEIPESCLADFDARKKIFHELLLEETKFHHQEFLKTLNPPIVLSAAAQIRRWHPLFDLSNVPDILPAPIPRLPCGNDAEGTEKEDLPSLFSLQEAFYSATLSFLLKIRAPNADRNLVE